MKLDKIFIGRVGNIPIHHGVLTLNFEDYDALFLKIRGRKPVRTEVYTASEEKGRDYMLGFVFIWEDGTAERFSFKDFWHLFDKNWDWGSDKETLGGYYRDGEYIPRYSVLSLKYTEVCFQTHQAGACAFDRVHDRVTGFTKDIEEMKESVRQFAASLRG